MSTRAAWLFEAPLAHERADYAAAEYDGSADGGAFEWEWHELSHQGIAEQPDHFVTKVSPLLFGADEGHEILTNAAARSLPMPLAPDELDALIVGVVTPDRGGPNYRQFPGAALHVLDAGEQRRHALRDSANIAVRTDVGKITDHLRGLYQAAMRSGRSPAAFRQIGETLHLIQDSYSQAHAQRTNRGTGPIVKVRRYWASPTWLKIGAAGLVSPFGVIPGLVGTLATRTTSPDEHNFPMDERDKIFTDAGRRTLKPEAAQAQDASAEYLAMVLRHLAVPGNPANAAELDAFISRHFAIA